MFRNRPHRRASTFFNKKWVKGNALANNASDSNTSNADHVRNWTDTLRDRAQKIKTANEKDAGLVMRFSSEMTKISAKTIEHPTSPFINPLAGTCVLDPNNVWATPLQNNADVYAMYNNNVKHRTGEDLQNSMNDYTGYISSEKKNCYVTTFGLVPNKEMPQEQRNTFTMNHEMASIAHTPVQFDVCGAVPIPLFGLCVSVEEIQSAVKLYKDNPSAQEYVMDAMVTLAQMADKFRKDDSIVHDNGWPSVTSTPTYTVTKKNVTSHGEVLMYTTKIASHYYYKQPRKMHGDAEINVIKTSAKIETMTLLPVEYHKDHGDSHLSHIKSYTTPETVLSQSVSFTATYYGSNVPTRGYDLKMVTVNTGPGMNNPSLLPAWKQSIAKHGENEEKDDIDPDVAAKMWTSKLGMIVYDIGNGIPIQYCIASKDGSMSNTSFIYSAMQSDQTACAEILSAAVARALRLAVTNSDQPIVQGFGVDKNDKIFNTFKNSIGRNKPNEKRDTNNILYMKINDVQCTPNQGLMTTGYSDPYFDLHRIWRSESVTVFACVGKSVAQLQNNEGEIWVPPMPTETKTRAFTHAHLHAFGGLNDAMSIMSLGSEIDMEEIMSMAARPSVFDD